MESKRLPLELLPMDGVATPAPSPSTVTPSPLAIEPAPSLSPVPPVPKAITRKDAPAQIVVDDGGPSPPTKPVDRFVSEATHQFKEGHIDQPLWARALEQAGGDKEKATETYLRARATALRVIDRELRARQRIPDAPALPVAPQVVTETQAKVPGNPSHRRHVRPLVRYGVPASVAVVALVAGAWAVNAFMASNSGVGVEMAPTAAPTVRAAAVARPAAPVAATAAEPTPTAGVTKEFLAKVQALQDAGNWNVLVLYATEWTRKEPSNPAAWGQLSLGYANLRQYSDARDAAKTAVKLAPADARYWRSLAQLNIDLDDPAEALVAFNRAAAVDDRDGYSLVQSGILNMQLGHLAEARVAFDRALALSPDDADALCLKGYLASRPNAMKPGESTPARVANGKCRALADAQPTSVPAVNAVALKTATPLAR